MHEINSANWTTEHPCPTTEGIGGAEDVESVKREEEGGEEEAMMKQLLLYGVAQI